MVANTFGTTSTGKPAGAISVPVGADLQALVDASPAGSTFWIEAGEHRMQSVTPKDNDHFIGQQGAILNGSRLITDFDKEGANWVATGQTQEGDRRATDQGNAGAERAGYPETFFIDDKPLTPVDSLDKVTPGKFYFDYAADKIYFQDDPAGHKVEAGVSPFAFRGGTGVTVENLVVEKYDSPTQFAAVGWDNSAKGWTIQNNEIRLNYGAGAYVGTDGKIVGNDVHDNGQLGLGGNGDNIVIQGNEIAHNGYFSGIAPGWEAGGSKFSQTDNLQVVDNYAHDNNGYGLWTDIDNIHTLYEGNTVTNNLAGGISHEISYDATIRNNVLSGNGGDSANWLWGGAIQIQNSKNVDVSGNHVDSTNGGNGITLIQQDRGDGAYGPHTTTGNTVHDNVIVDASTGSGGVSGSVADYDPATLQNGGNSFSNNQYHFADPSAEHFSWTDAYYNWDGFRQASGQDGSSTISTEIPVLETGLSGSAGVGVTVSTDAAQPQPAAIAATEPASTEPVATAPAAPAATDQPAATTHTAAPDEAARPAAVTPEPVASATDGAATPEASPAPTTVAATPTESAPAAPADEAAAAEGSSDPVATATGETAPAASTNGHHSWADLFSGHGGDSSFASLFSGGHSGHGGHFDWSGVANALQSYADAASHGCGAQSAQAESHAAELGDLFHHGANGSHTGLTL